MIAPRRARLRPRSSQAPALDAAGAKKLMAEAGYPNGFEVDAWTAPTTATSTTSRSARPSPPCWRASASRSISTLMPKTRYFEKMRSDQRVRYFLQPARLVADTLDSWNVLANLVALPRCNRQGAATSISAAIAIPGSTSSPPRSWSRAIRPSATDDRRGLSSSGLQQDSACAAAPAGARLGRVEEVKLTQRADNQILLYWLRKD